MPKIVRGLFQNSKYQKKSEEGFWRHQEICSKKSHRDEKTGSLIGRKSRKGDGTLLLWNGFVFHVRGFVCVQNQVLSTYGKSAVPKKWTDRIELAEKTSHCKRRAFSPKTPTKRKKYFKASRILNLINSQFHSTKKAKGGLLGLTGLSCFKSHQIP